MNAEVTASLAFTECLIGPCWRYPFCDAMGASVESQPSSHIRRLGLRSDHPAPGSGRDQSLWA